MVAFALLAIVAVLLAASVLLGARDDPERVADLDGIEQSVEQPAGDILVPLVQGAGEVLDLGLLPAGVPLEAFGRVVPGSLAHLATAQIDGNTTHLFVWESLDQGPVAVSCSGTFGELSGSLSCGRDDVNGPSLLWGSSFDDVGGAHNVLIENAPTTAVWMVIETSDGSRVVSNLVAGHGYAGWDDRFGEPASVMLLDANHDTVWTEKVQG